MHGQSEHSAYDLVVLLRALVGKPTDQPTPRVLAASVRRLVPEGLDINVGGWIVWTILGLYFFSSDSRSMVELRTKTRGVIVGMVMLRAGGSISAAAKLLWTSRRSLRDGLLNASLYPWPGDLSDDEVGDA